MKLTTRVEMVNTERGFFYLDTTRLLFFYAILGLPHVSP